MNGEILSVPLDNITIGARVGFYHPAHAEHIAESYRVHGQIDPIHLRRNGPRADRPWTLVAGLHRLRAAEIVGWQDVKAIQVADKTSDKQTLLRLELSENLDHRSPRPIERAMFITARARIEEAFDFPDMQWMKRESRAAHARWLKQRAIDIALGRPLKGNLPDPEAEDVIAREFGEPNLDAKDIMSSASSRPVELEVLNEDWQARTARAMGCSDRTIRRYIAIHRALVEPYPLDIVEQLNAHPLLESFAGAMRLARVRAAQDATGATNAKLDEGNRIAATSSETLFDISADIRVMADRLTALTSGGGAAFGQVYSSEFLTRQASL